jgi:hypothetical protein
MEFFLPFKIKNFPFKIDYQDKILFVGSCFSEEISNRLSALKFNVLENPNGILYDPLSIANSIFSYVENKTFTEKDLFQLNHVWHSWQHHSSFSGADKKLVLERINSSQATAHEYLKEASVLILTFGTAYNYSLKKENITVANCHKAPADSFNKTLLGIEKMTDGMRTLITALRVFNPSLKIILTVSPVKHINDGVVENNRSKARLIEMTHSVFENEKDVFYFPSFEIVNDVLRDYRFYKNDLVHPNETAIDFVFEKFSDSFFDNSTKEIVSEIKKMIAAVSHKPFFKESEGHKKFITDQLKNIERLIRLYPFLDLSAEQNHFSNSG